MCVRQTCRPRGRLQIALANPQPRMRELAGESGADAGATLSTLNTVLERHTFYGMRAMAAGGLNQLHTHAVMSALFAALRDPTLANRRSHGARQLPAQSQRCAAQFS